MGKLRPAIVAVIGALTLLFSLGQGCSQSSRFSSTAPPVSLARGGSGNGDGYDGKLTFIHLEAGFRCEDKIAPQSVLVRRAGTWRFTVNERSKCAVIESQVVNDVEYREGSTQLTYRNKLYSLAYGLPDTPVSLAGVPTEYVVDPSTDPNTIDVSPGDDLCANASGKCSLMAAFDEMNSVLNRPAILRVPSGLYAMTSILNVNFSSVALIYGEGPTPPEINGGGTTRLLNTGLWAGAMSTTIVDRLVFKKAYGDGSFTGAAITVDSSLIVLNSQFIGNLGGFHGTIYGTVSSRDILVRDSIFRGNKGNAIGAFGSKSLAIERSEFDGNEGFGLNISNGTWNISVRDSTFTGNGGGIRYRKCYTSCVIENTTVTGNLGYGVEITAPTRATDVYIRNSTIAGNALVSGANFYFLFMGTVTEHLFLQNSIVAKPAGGRPNCVLPEGAAQLAVTSSIIDDASCGGLGLNVDPLLGGLSDNGGPTKTLAPLFGSPAIDAGDNLTCPLRDQRGHPRPVGGTCDIGAVEMQ